MAVSLKQGVYVVAGKRTPFGKYGGMLSYMPMDDMFATAARAALKASRVSPETVDTVNIGTTCNQWKPNLVAKHAVTKSGMPLDTPVLTVNKLSGSGLMAAIASVQEILIGSAQVSVAGGMENNSSTPFLVRNARLEVPRAKNLELESWISMSFIDTYAKINLNQNGDMMAKEYHISREEADEFALNSHWKWKSAKDSGIIDTEVVPVTIAAEDGSYVTLTTDEAPRPDCTIEDFRKQSPLFEDGTITAANICGIADGAGVIVLASEDAMRQQRLSPLSRVAGWCCVGVEPAMFGAAPVPAVRGLLNAANLTVRDIDLFEIHETYATQALACANELKIDRSKLNPNGGAICMGHPPSASGARLIAHVSHELRRRNLKRAMISICVGGGQGVAVLIEAV